MTEQIEMTNALALPDEQTFKRDMEAINRFQRIVHSTMVEGQDYGVIPGTNKPTLLKPGAEKIAKLLKLSDQYEFVDRQENWEKPFFRFLIRCKLVYIPTGVLISEGLGECNSMEDKYRWRESKRKCPTCGGENIIKGKAEFGGGWLCFKKIGGCGATFTIDAPAIINQKVGKVENEDIYSQVNTILKMAKKRALVDAALSAGRLSDVFTQDMEDIEIKPEVQKAPEKHGDPMGDSARRRIVAEQKPEAEEVVKPEQEQATLPVVASGADRPAMMPQSIKTGAQLAAYAGKHGINSVQFTAITQAANPNDLKSEAQLIAAWNVLAPKLVK